MQRLCSIVDDLGSPYYSKMVRQAVLKKLTTTTNNFDVLTGGGIT
jgi:hypothetical protein